MYIQYIYRNAINLITTDYELTYLIRKGFYSTKWIKIYMIIKWDRDMFVYVSSKFLLAKQSGIVVTT